MDNTVYKGFIHDWAGRTLLPITRGELVLDSDGKIALQSEQFLAKDGHPGLITSSERALIASLSSAGGALEQVADIYAKLDYLNVLTFNGTALNFFNSTTNKATPIEIITDGSIGIAANVNNNKVTFSLPVLQTNSTTVENQIIKNIKVDKYGRVTEVNGSTLTNSDIPNILSGKTLQNCTTDGDPTTDAAIVNKGYVDGKFNNISAVSTGALKFGGGLSSKDTAEATLTNKACWNHYYKVTAAFDLSVNDLYDTAGIVGSTVKVKVGDTLVIYPTSETATKAKFVYVPSGDEITAVTVTTPEHSTPPYKYAGDVVLKFSDLFEVANPQTNIANIALKQASAETGGYLSKEDWKKFNSYASQESTTYVGEFSEGAGVYKIGTLTIAGVEEIIYGKYSTSSLSLENGTGANVTYNPILKFTSTGQSDVNITITGGNGIITKKNGNNIEIVADNQVIEQTVPQSSARKVKYITIEDGHKFGVKIGSSNELTGEIIEDGLVDFSQFNALVNNMKYTTVFEAITYSLKGSENISEYRYGNDKLKAAVNITI